MPRLTEAEKFQRKADRINAKAAAELPLFADQLEKTTGEAEYWRWRHQKAQVEGGVSPRADGVYTGGFTILTGVLHEVALRQLAQRHLSAEVFQGLWAYRRRTYPLPGPEYGISFWTNVLAGTRRVVFSVKKVGEKVSQYGTFPILEDDGFWPPADWVSPYTAEQLREMFAWKSEPTKPAPDDGGMADFVDLILLRNCKP